MTKRRIAGQWYLSTNWVLITPTFDRTAGTNLTYREHVPEENRVCFEDIFMQFVCLRPSRRFIRKYILGKVENKHAHERYVFHLGSSNQGGECRHGSLGLLRRTEARRSPSATSRLHTLKLHTLSEIHGSG